MSYTTLITVIYDATPTSWKFRVVQVREDLTRTELGSLLGSVEAARQCDPHDPRFLFREWAGSAVVQRGGGYLVSPSAEVGWVLDRIPPGTYLDKERIDVLNLSLQPPS